MPVEAGSAYATFRLDLTQLQSDVNEARNAIKQLRDSLQVPIPVTVELTADEAQLAAMADNIRKQVVKKFGGDIEIPVILRVREERGAAVAGTAGAQARAAAAGRPAPAVATPTARVGKTDIEIAIEKATRKDEQELIAHATQANDAAKALAAQASATRTATAETARVLGEQKAIRTREREAAELAFNAAKAAAVGAQAGSPEEAALKEAKREQTRTRKEETRVTTLYNKAVGEDATAEAAVTDANEKLEAAKQHLATVTNAAAQRQASLTAAPAVVPTAQNVPQVATSAVQNAPVVQQPMLPEIEAQLQAQRVLEEQTARQIRLQQQLARATGDVTTATDEQVIAILKLARAEGDYNQQIAATQELMLRALDPNRKGGADQGAADNYLVQLRRLEKERDAAISKEQIDLAKRDQMYAQHTTAIQRLEQHLATLTVGSKEYMDVERALDQVRDKAIKSEERHEDALTATALAARKLDVALQSNRDAMLRTDPDDPKDRPRRDQLATQEQEILRRQNDALITNERSQIRLLLQQNKSAEAIKVVDEALKRSLPTTTANNNLQARRLEILHRVEADLRKMEDSEIAEARAAGNQTLAHERLNAALERQRLLQKELGGLGGQAIVPLGAPRRAVGAPGTEGESTPRIDRLLATRAVISEMPTYFSRAASAALRFVGPVAAVTLAMEGLRNVTRQVIEGFRDIENIEFMTRSLGALFNSMQRGEDVMKAAIDFGRQYGITQEEMAQAAGDAGIILQTTNLQTEKAFEILSRLQTRAPQQNFAAAVRSIAELQSGQLQSIERVFNIPRRFAHEMADAIKAGEDPLVALDRVLNKLGQTVDVLEARQSGLTRAFNDARVASTDLRIETARMFEGPVIRGVELFADVIGRVALVLANFQTTWENVSDTVEQGGNVLEIVSLQWDTFMDNIYGRRTELIETIDTIDDLNKALAESQAYQNFLHPENIKKANDEITDFGTRIGVIFSRLGQDQVNAAQAARQFAEARKVTNDLDRDAAIGVQMVQAARNNAHGDAMAEMSELQNSLLVFQAMINERPEFAEHIGADIDVVMRRLAQLDAMHIEITAEIKMQRAENMTQFLNNVTARTKQWRDDLDRLSNETGAEVASLTKQRTDLIVEYYQNISKARKDFNRERDRENRDFARDQALATQEFGRSQSQSQVEFARQQARQASEFARGLAREDEDRALAHQRRDRDRKQQDEREEREHQRELIQAQEEFNRERLRSEQDFQDEYRGLLATGRRAEAAVALFRFNRDRNRELDDFNRGQQEETRSRQEQLDERKRQREQEDADEAADFTRRRQQAEADFAHSRALAAEDFQRQYDERAADFERQQQQQRDNLKYQQDRRDEDFELQLQEMKSEFIKQRDEIDANMRAVLQKYVDTHAQINADYVTYYKEQVDMLTQNNKDILTLEELKKTGLTTKEAEVVLMLEASLKEYKRVLGEGGKLIADSGYDAGLDWAEQLAKGILAGIQANRPFVDPGYYPPDYGAAPQGTGRGGTGGGGYSAGARIGPQYKIGNLTDVDDPRPGTSALQQAFGSGAYLHESGGTFDSDRPDSTIVHKGLDVWMKPGTKFTAPRQMFIQTIYGDKYTKVGQTIEAIDDKGREWLFAHFGTVNVRKGQTVPKGWVLGTAHVQVGHVHVQLKSSVNGSIIDPSQDIEEAGGGTGGGSFDDGGGAAGPVGYYNPNTREVSALVGPASAIGVSAKDIARLQQALNIVIEPPDRTVNVNVTVPPIIMDGQVVGRITAPIAYDLVVEDFRVAVSVTEASQQPTLAQGSFRGVR